MRLATIKWNDKEICGIVTAKGVLPLAALNASRGTDWKEEMLPLIRTGQLK